MGVRDLTKRQVFGVATTPVGNNNTAVAYITPSISGGNSFSLRTTATPFTTVLGLWNFSSSVSVDNPYSTNDGGYIFPYGTSLSSGQLSMVLSHWVDWVKSNDLINKRVYMTYIKNNDTAPHVYYIYVEAATWSTSPGVSA